MYRNSSNHATHTTITTHTTMPKTKLKAENGARVAVDGYDSHGVIRYIDKVTDKTEDLLPLLSSSSLLSCTNTRSSPMQANHGHEHAQRDGSIDEIACTRGFVHDRCCPARRLLQKQYADWHGQNIQPGCCSFFFSFVFL